MRNQIYQSNKGMTLIEVTLVIAVLLGLISVTYIGARVYKEGANRAVCIQNIANAQKAVRVFSNFNEIVAGTEVEGLSSRIFAEGGFLPAEPECPSNGEYTHLEETIPELGTLYLTCSLPSHAPKEHAVW